MCFKIVNIKANPTPEYDIYIGRENIWLNLPQSKWANPFVMKNESDRQRVLIEYEKHIRKSPELIKALPELANKTLGCYCAPKRCHGNVLKDLYIEFYITKESED